MSWLVLALWTILAFILGLAAMYVVGWRNWSDGWEGGIPTFAFIFGLGLIHWRKLRKYD
ncbi:MAG: hypothetical protein AAFX86_01400 [Pseudomonadota bacterium]